MAALLTDDGVAWTLVLGTVRNESCDSEFQIEIEEHVRLLTERYRRQGMTAEAAMLAARRQFGNTCGSNGGFAIRVTKPPG